MGLNISGFKKFCEKIMKKYVSKDDIFGSGNLGSSGEYNPGLVPSGHPSSTANMYLKGDGTWALPCIRGGTFTKSSVGTTTFTIGGISKNLKYIEIHDENGSLAMSATVNNNSVTQVCNKAGSITSVTFSSGSYKCTIGIGSSSGSKYYWTAYGEY